MPCTCISESCDQIEISGVIYCQCEIVIPDIQCPEDCTTIIMDDGNVQCGCVDSVTAIVENSRTPVYFDDDEFFEENSWTIAFKPNEGSWVSYFSFYPDYSVALNNMFQVGYNFGKHKETLWTHLMNRSSFCVFQGEKHIPIVEYIIPNENTNKILNSIALNIEGVHYTDEWNWSIDKDISFKNMYIYNRTNNSGMLGLNPQKTLTDNRNYPKTVGDTQDILFTSSDDKQSVNYFFNRVVQQSNNIPMFNIDKNNIFKTINTNAVKFSVKKVLERLRGEWFTVHLEGVMDTRYGLIFKNSINNLTEYE